MRPLVVVSKDNAASQNIKSAILRLEEPEEMGGGFWSASDFDIAEYPGSIVEIIPSHDAEYYIFASTHRSASNMPSLTVHTPGNWGPAELGGKERCLNNAYAGKVKIVAQEMARLAPQLPGWSVSVEVDHHGPTLSKPVMFVEIGSSEAEWGIPEAGKIAAQAIIAAVRNTRVWPAYVGFGGTHYAAKFGGKILDGEISFGHIISGYALEKYGCDGGRILQAMNKNDAKIECALLDWKGIKGERRKELIEALDRMKIAWKKA